MKIMKILKNTANATAGAAYSHFEIIKRENYKNIENYNPRKKGGLFLTVVDDEIIKLWRTN